MLVFRSLKDKLGQLRSKVGITSGGFLAPDVFRYLRALGIKVRQAYALTEGGIVSFHREGDLKYETVGQPMPGVEVRLTDGGEVITRSDMVITEYWRDPEASRARLKEGWLYTGDAAYFDEDGHMVIIDRVGDLAELADGTKFSPSYLESRLRFSPYIREVIAIGGKDKPCVTAVVSIDFENVARWAESHRISYTTLVDLSQKAEVCEMIGKEVGKVNRTLPEKFRVKRFVNLHKELDADEAELTRTKKLRRTFTEVRYGPLIEALYADHPEVEMDAEVKYRDGRVGKVGTRLKVVSLP